MKSIQHKLLTICLLLTAFCSCSKSDITPDNSLLTSSIIVQGTWKITYFKNNGSDGTFDFNGFKFIFDTTGKIIAFNDLYSINGTWNSFNDDSQNKLLINFGVIVAQFAGLNKDWHILEKSKIKLQMEYISGGGSGTDYLTIEKL